MKIAFFTWITDNYRNSNIDFDGFYKSFKYFHPDIDLIVFDNSVIGPLFQSKPWLKGINCKASFAKLLYKDYDLLVNVDADFYFFDRCYEILEANYDIAACSNFNIVQNVSLQQQVLSGISIPYVDEKRYIQGGLIASTNKNFWDEYEYLSMILSEKLPIYENDVFNIIWYSNKYKTKILDGDYNYQLPNFSCYYNCSSLGRTSECIIKNDRVFLDDKPMRSYHVAHGWENAKPRLKELFPKTISEWFYSKIQ